MATETLFRVEGGLPREILMRIVTRNTGEGPALPKAAARHQAIRLKADRYRIVLLRRKRNMTRVRQAMGSAAEPDDFLGRRAARIANRRGNLALRPAHPRRFHVMLARSMASFARDSRRHRGQIRSPIRIDADAGGMTVETLENILRQF